VQIIKFYFLDNEFQLSPNTKKKTI